jgi:hypothetical protein
MIFMTHPLHGATNVLPSEVPEMQKSGWKISTHEAWMGAKAKIEPEKRRYTRKPKQ